MTERCGFVGIIGRPSVGKSTFLNQVLGQKISITASKPQTTRDRIFGVRTEDGAQSIYIDTPGLHRLNAKASRLNQVMNKSASSTIREVDAMLFLVEAGKWHSDDEWILNKLMSVSYPVILVINKVDRLHESHQIYRYIEQVKDKFPFHAIIPISALKKKSTVAVEEQVMSCLQEGEHFFPQDAITDKPEAFIVSEIIRERLIRHLHAELPYQTAVVIDQIIRKPKKAIEIYAEIWVGSDNQKAIVIGKKGEKLKQISTEARKSLEKFFLQKVYLRAWVKVKSNWHEDQQAIFNLSSINE